MKKFTLISFIFLLFSCGSRTKNVQKENIETNNQSLGTASAKVDTNIKSETLTNTKLSDLGFGFSLTPVNGRNSFINLISGKDTVSVQTNAKVEFNKNNKVQQTETKTIYQKINSYWSQTTYKSVTTYKSSKKNSQTERNSYPIWMWIAVGFFLKILIHLLWKWFKTTTLFAKLPIIKI